MISMGWMRFKDWPENSHHWEKYHCTAELLFNWFGFDQASKAVANSTIAKHLNQHKMNRTSVSRTVIVPLKSVFSGLTTNFIRHKFRYSAAPSPPRSRSRCRRLPASWWRRERCWTWARREGAASTRRSPRVGRRRCPRCSDVCADRNHLLRKYKNVFFVGYLKMSFYYPTSHE